jgi:hypothetical protein
MSEWHEYKKIKQIQDATTLRIVRELIEGLHPIEPTPTKEELMKLLDQFQTEIEEYDDTKPF